VSSLEKLSARPRVVGFQERLAPSMSPSIQDFISASIDAGTALGA